MIGAGIISVGRFKLLKYRGDDIVAETPFFSNLIVRGGFSHMLGSNSGAIIHPVLGTGASSPAITNTAMNRPLTGTATVISTDTYREFIPDSEGNIRWRTVYRFRYAPGSLSGSGTVDLREVGIATDTTLVSRALLKGVDGSTVSLPLDVATEGLDVVWEYIEYIAPESLSVLSVQRRRADGSVASTAEHTITVRPANFTSTGEPTDGWVAMPLGQIPSCVFEAARNSFGTGVIGTILDSPVFTHAVEPDTLTASVIGSGTPKNLIVASFGLNTANFVGGIDCVSLCLGHTQWQLAITPPIMKQDTQELRLEFSIEMENL